MAESSANSYTVSLLEEVAEFLADYADVRDGSDGEQVPNHAMHLQSVVEGEIERLKRASLRGPVDEARELLVRALDRMEMYDPHTQVREDIEDYLERSSRSATQEKGSR
jgi:hypothetical protein